MEEKDLGRALNPTERISVFLDPRRPFNDWKGRGCNKFVPALGGNGTKIAPTGDILDQPPGQMR